MLEQETELASTAFEPEGDIPAGWACFLGQSQLSFSAE